MEHNITNQEQEQLLTTQLNAENNHNKNSSLVETQPIDGTPFVLRKQNEKWFLTLSDYRITSPTDTKESTLAKLETEKWLILVDIIIITSEKLAKNPNLIEQAIKQSEGL